VAKRMICDYYIFSAFHLTGAKHAIVASGFFATFSACGTRDLAGAFI
jgi:hypothetical protein